MWGASLKPPSPPAGPQEARGKRHSHADSYFFDLDHVLGMHADRTTKAKDKQRLPPLPPGLDPEEGEHLLVDALSIGGWNFSPAAGKETGICCKLCC